MTTTAPQTRSDIPWKKILEEWRDRDFSTLRDAVYALEGMERKLLDDIDDLFPPRTKDGVESSAKEPAGVLAAAFEAARTDERALLALHVYGLCLKRWEDSEDYASIERVLEALREVDLPGGSKDAADLFHIVKLQAQHLKPAMGVEQAMNCACPIAMTKRAGEIGPLLEKRLEEESNLRDGSEAGLRELVRVDAETSLAYFGTIAKVADAVRAFVESDRPESFDFDGVLSELDKEELAKALEGDVYESELRPHRAALKALEDGASQPRLVIDAELVYLYPFALDQEIDLATLLKDLLKDGVILWRDEEHPLPLAARQLERNDIWDRPKKPDDADADAGDEPDDADAVPGQGYWFVSIDLPDIAVTTAADLAVTTAADLPLEFSGEVRISSLGNHHVRIESRLRNAGVTELNQALRRGTPAMGGEALEWEGQPAECTKFANYAADVIAEIGKAVQAKPVVDLNAQFHVVVAARRITVRQPGADPSPAKLTQLGVRDGATRAGPPEPETPEPVVGASLLFHPIRHLATSLEEWVRYPAPEVTNLLAGRGYVGDLVVRTENTTLSYLPTSPDWLAEEYGEMIEFVASIPPLLTLWATQAEKRTDALDNMLPGIEERIENGDDPIEVLFEQEKEIRLLESKIRRDLAVLHSPGLCRASTHRQFIDDVWNAAGLPRLEEELDRRLTLLAERQQRIARLVSSIDQRFRREQQAQAERLEREQVRRAAEQKEQAEHYEHEQEKRARRQAAPVNALLVLFGVASLAGVFALVNQTWPITESPAAVLIEGFFLLMALLIAGWFPYQAWKSTKDTDR